MSSELGSPSAQLNATADPVRVDADLRCALTGRVLRPDEAYWAPPLITARELIGTLFTTLTRTPGNLGQVLLGEQPNVPYAPEARQELGSRRTTEQLKVLGLLFLIAAIFIIPIVMLIG